MTKLLPFIFFMAISPWLYADDEYSDEVFTAVVFMYWCEYKKVPISLDDLSKVTDVNSNDPRITLNLEEWLKSAKFHTKGEELSITRIREWSSQDGSKHKNTSTAISNCSSHKVVRSEPCGKGEISKPTCVPLPQEVRMCRIQLEILPKDISQGLKILLDINDRDLKAEDFDNIRQFMRQVIAKARECESEDRAIYKGSKPDYWTISSSISSLRRQIDAAARALEIGAYHTPHFHNTYWRKYAAEFNSKYK